MAALCLHGQKQYSSKFQLQETAGGEIAVVLKSCLLASNGHLVDHCENRTLESVDHLLGPAGLFLCSYVSCMVGALR